MMENRKLWISASVLFSLVILGIFGFHFIEGESLLDSLYWTVATITTVGYGDIPVDTDLGRILAIFLMIFGVSTILYVLTLVGKNIIGGKIWDFFTMSEKEDEVEKIKNHYIICGYGDIGKAVARELHSYGNDIVIIDQDETVLREEAADYPYIVGDATGEEALQKAGVDKAQGLFATLPSDPDNILLILSAKGIRSDIEIVAKAEDIENNDYLHRAGATAVISPDTEGGIRMARSLLHPEITTFYDNLLQGDIGKAGTLDIPEGGLLDGVKIKDSELRKDTGVSVIAIMRDGELLINPSVEEEIMKDDTLITMGSPKQIEKMKEKFGKNS